MLLVKQFSLALALAAFLAVTYAVVNRSFFDAWRAPLSGLLEAAIVGLFVVPWLTMVFRNALAGAVFSIAIPLLIVVIGGTLQAMLDGTPGGGHAITAATGYRVVIALGLIGGTMMWPTFLRLEALGPRDTNITERWSISTQSAEPTKPYQGRLWTELRKELHLQQLPAALALIYAPVMTGFALGLHDEWRVMTVLITEFYSAFIAVLAVTSVTARERELGTLDWQLSLPASAAVHWGIKVVVATTSVLLLGLLLPFELARVLRLPLASLPSSSIKEFVLVILGVVVLAVYVSSLCRSALSAALITLLAAIGAYAFSEFSIARMITVILAFMHVRLTVEGSYLGVWLLFAIFGGLALRLSYANHRSMDRSPERIAIQIGALAMADLTAWVLGSVLAQFI